MCTCMHACTLCITHEIGIILLFYLIILFLLVVAPPPPFSSPKHWPIPLCLVLWEASMAGFLVYSAIREHQQKKERGKGYLFSLIFTCGPLVPVSHVAYRRQGSGNMSLPDCPDASECPPFLASLLLHELSQTSSSSNRSIAHLFTSCLGDWQHLRCV